MNASFDCSKPVSKTVWLAVFFIVIVSFVSVAYMDYQTQRKKEEIQQKTEQIIQAGHEKRLTILKDIIENKNN